MLNQCLRTRVFMKQFCFIGLGNLPETFSWTYHNIGKEFVLYCSKEYDIPLKKNSYCSFFILQQDTFHLTFLFPHTFMNESGKILPFLLKDKLAEKKEDHLIIGYDDLGEDIFTFKIRTNPDRGERAHNGLRSIFQHSQSLFNAKRPLYAPFGVWNKKEKHPTPGDYVLSKIPLKEKELFIQKTFPGALQTLITFCQTK